MSERKGLVYDLPEAEYHGVKTELSATGAKLILEEAGPAKYKHQIIDGHREHKDSFDLGSAVHAKVLGVGWGIEELDFKDFRTKAAQTARDEAREAGLIPMLKHDLAEVNACAESVLAHPMAGALLGLEGAPEVSVFARDPDTGVELRCRFDKRPAEHTAVLDLKSTGTDASARGFAKTAAKFKYNVQEAHYLHTNWLATGEERRMVFIVVETTAPYLVAVHQLDNDFLEAGRVEARRAREIFAECMETGKWPGYAENIGLLSMPNWAFWEHNEEFGESQ